MPSTEPKPLNNEEEIEERFLHRYSVWKTLFLWNEDVLTSEQAVRELGVCDVNEANWVRQVAFEHGKREKLASMF